jgi:hypothetical protein
LTTFTKTQQRSKPAAWSAKIGSHRADIIFSVAKLSRRNAMEFLTLLKSPHRTFTPYVRSVDLFGSGYQKWHHDVASQRRNLENVMSHLAKFPSIESLIDIFYGNIWESIFGSN